MANGGYRERQGIYLSERFANVDGKLVFGASSPTFSAII